jgi:hypothetical protein
LVIAMMKSLLGRWPTLSLLGLMTGVLLGCNIGRPTAPPFVGESATIAPSASPSAVATEIATVSEIQAQPVWVRPREAAQEISAQENMGLQIGETIRTEGTALAEIAFINGLAFRIGGDAVLTLQPDNRLNLESGEMITWVEPGRSLPAEIVTPGGVVAGIRGTTVFVQIPEDPQEGILFFAWEGTVALRLPGQTEEVLLRDTEQVRIRPDETDVEQIRQRVRRLSRQEWLERRQNSQLLNRFNRPLPTLPEIERVAPPAS